MIVVTINQKNKIVTFKKYKSNFDKLLNMLKKGKSKFTITEYRNGKITNRYSKA